MSTDRRYAKSDGTDDAAVLRACPHRPPFPVAHSELNTLARVYGLPEVTVISGSAGGFRHRARLAIRGRLGSPKLGLFELGTHHVVHIPNCGVHHPLINRVAAVVRRALVDARVTSYSDRAHLGVARYLQIVIERSSQSAQVVLVANSATPEPLAPCLELIRERLGRDLHSLWFNSNCERSNTILGPEFQHWYGPASVVERFGGAAVHYPPGAFGQNNLDIGERLIAQVRVEIPRGACVAEFYAGVGAIGLSVLEQAGELRINELNPHSLHGLELGLAVLDPADRTRIAVFPGPAGAARLAASGAQVVIADPPRRGLDSELIEYFHEWPPERLIYVSCGLESFLADTRRLTAAGGLRLAALTAFNLLPYTEHVEIVARFERA
jgi:tRNA/tmRNA/rRNA uracil-C5-methylase (TrmA/RlmC/RlmD family)